MKKKTKKLLKCVAIDSIDLFENAVTVVISATGIGLPAGWGINTVTDFLQIGLGFILFEDKSFAFTALGDVVLPQGLDIFPTYTATYIYQEYIQK